MSYKDTYQQAMEKICADDAWKQKTLAQMQAQSKSRPAVVVWKKAALSAAALVVVMGGILAQRLFVPSAGEALNAPQPINTNPSVQEDSFENTPRAILSDEIPQDLPPIEFSSQQLEEIDQRDLPFEIDTANAPHMLPIWQKIQGEWEFLGDYPLISEMDAALLVDSMTEQDKSNGLLTYVESKGFLQPAYHFHSETTDTAEQYIPAVLGKYYE